MFLHLEAMLLQMQFHTFEKRALLYSSTISKYFVLFPIDGQRFLQSVFGFQLQCFVFLFSGVKRPRQYRTQYILSLFELGRHTGVVTVVKKSSSFSKNRENKKKSIISLLRVFPPPKKEGFLDIFFVDFYTIYICYQKFCVVDPNVIEFDILQMFFAT